MKLAVDVQVSNRAINYLENNGFVVVYKARESEMDRQWFERAMTLGAEIFISADWDISFLCNQHNYKFVQLRQGIRSETMGKYIKDMISKGKFS